MGFLDFLKTKLGLTLILTLIVLAIIGWSISSYFESYSSRFLELTRQVKTEGQIDKYHEVLKEEARASKIIEVVDCKLDPPVLLAQYDDFRTDTIYTVNNRGDRKVVIRPGMLSIAPQTSTLVTLSQIFGDTRFLSNVETDRPTLLKYQCYLPPDAASAGEGKIWIEPVP